MNAGERVRILSGPGAGHEGTVISVHAGYVKLRTADFGSGLAGERIITKPTRFVQRVKVFEQFQGREFKPWVPPKPVIRDGALDFKACPSHYGELAQS
jgi:transcription antitermination factor NusG